MNTSLETRIDAFAQLGLFLRLFTQNNCKAIPINQLAIKSNADDFNNLQTTLENYVSTAAYNHNAWFTPTVLKTALQSWATALSKENLQLYCAPYKFIKTKVLNIGLVMAGNLPLVGYHDYMSVLLSGHKALIKLSSDDHILLPLLHKILSCFSPNMASSAKFCEQGKLKDFEAVIATGSNNSARYFNYYFGNYPHIIRRSRHSVAVLDGTETDKELQALAQDVFLYFGRGCRSVSKIYVPKAYAISQLMKHLSAFSHLTQHSKYMNNYDYHKAIFLVNKTPHYDNGFALLTENSAFSTPISVLHYAYYSDSQSLKTELTQNHNQLQCIVGKADKHIYFGQAQFPNLEDFADGVDTMDFLTNL